MSIGTQAGGFIEMGLMCRTTRYHSQYRRPMHANFGQNINALAEIAAGNDFSKERLAPIAATSLTMSPQYEAEAGIIGGWGEERCLFALKIVHQSNHANTMRLVQYLQGYTDHMGMHMGNGGIIGGPAAKISINPQMRLFFNSSLLFQENTTVNGYGQQQTTVTPVEASQLLMGATASLQQGTYTLRPEDVYSLMHTQEVVQSVSRYQEHNGQGAQVNMQDGRVMFQNGQPLKKSARTNLIPSNYMSKLLSTPSNIVMAYQGEQNVDVANKAATSLSSGYVASDMTLGMMLERTGLSENGSITYGELCQLFQNADGTIVRLGMESAQVQGAHGQNSEYMNGANWETIISQMMQNVVAALMVETSMRKIMLAGDNFSASDMTQGTIGGQFKINALNGQSFIQGRPWEFSCEQVKMRLIQEFLVGFTGHNYVPIGFSLYIDLYGECVIDVTYNGGPVTRYATPMFGDSLYSPMLTDNRSTLAHLSAETRQVTHNLLNVL